MTTIISEIISLPSPFNMVVLIVLIACGANAVTSIAAEIRKYAAARDSNELVRDLASHGMSAGEIERVLQSQGGHKSPAANARGGGQRATT